MKKLDIVLLSIIFLTAVGVRLYGIGNPIADWHSWRQVDTAAVARNFLHFGIDPLHPRYDDLSNIQSGKDNPMGYRMVEFPLYQTVSAIVARTFPFFSLEIWLRVVTIAVSAGSAVFIALIVYHIMDPLSGFLAGMIYAALPYSIYYGRTILPDPSMVFWAIVSIWCVVFGKSLRWTIVAALCGALALLSKPMAAFLLIPIPYMLYRHYGISRRLVFHALIYAVMSLVPLILWRQWIVQFPEGIPVSSWLLNGNGIRFKGAWFHWLFASRLGDLILGFWGLIPFGVGLVVAPTKKEGWFFRWWAFGVLAYFIVFASGNVQHDYYQILIIPMVAVFAAKGLAYLIKGAVGIHKMAAWVVACASVAAMIGFSWFTIRTYYWINRPEIVEAGKMADALLPKDAKVIAPYNGDTTFLYQTRRQGWPLGFDIDKKIKMGATAYVTVSPTDADTETRDLALQYTVLVRNDRFAIIDLTRPKEATPSPQK